MLHENAILSKRLFEEIFTHSFCREGMGGIFHSQFFLRQLQQLSAKRVESDYKLPCCFQESAD